MPEVTPYDRLPIPLYPKPAASSATNWVAVLSPIVTFLLTFGANAVGIPVPPGLLDVAIPVIIGQIIQSGATLYARNRKGGGGQTKGVFDIPG